MPDLRGKDYFTLKEAAHYLGNGMDNTRKFLTDNGIPQATIAGTTKVRKTDLQRAIEQQWQKSGGATVSRILSGTRTGNKNQRASAR